ncbi:MAG: membrane protein [Patescibacteria group bacterium]|nr:MAG: membrane protein [Patescibacteria group bacterium]
MTFSLVAAIKKNLNFIAILLVITVIGYIFSLSNSFVWDDEQFIYNNEYVKNFQIKKILTENTVAGAGETSTYYRPLTTLSFAFDHAIWGLNPFGFHLTNTLLHLGTGLFLFFYLRILRFSRITSLVISSIFLIHPLQTEAVVYANSRGDSMYSFWAMLSLLSYALLLIKKYPKIIIYDLELTYGKIALFCTTIFGYAFAILSKEIGIATLGLLAISLLFVNIQNKKVSFKTVLQKTLENKLATVTVLTTILIACLYLFFRTSIIAIPTTQNQFFAGTSYGESMYVRLHTFTQAIWTYFGLIIVPYPLHMERTLAILEQPVSTYLIATIVLCISLGFFSVLEYKKSKTIYIAFGTMWFFSMLVPVSGIIPVNGFIYEHWLYLPIIGFCIALYGLFNTVTPRKYIDPLKNVLQGILILILFLYSILTIRQNYIWGDPIRFYNYTLQFSQSARLHNNLAMAYAENGDYQNAIEQYTKAIALGDYYPQSHHNLGNTYLAIGEVELAKKEFSTAIRMNENFMPSYIPLIKIFLQEQSYENAITLVDKLIATSPQNIELQNLRSQIKELQQK